jgi:hypothetical protein
VRGAGKPLTLERILQTIDRYLSPSDAALLGRAVAGDVDIRAMTPSAGQLAPCVQVTLDIMADSAQHRVSPYPQSAAELVPQLRVSSDYRPRLGACGLSGR